MSEFTIRSESVDVEQIMKQIRARILEKRGADYTEEQIRELASVRLEKFLEPRNLRSDLLEQFRKSRPAVNTEPSQIEAPYAFDDQTLFASHRAAAALHAQAADADPEAVLQPEPVLNQILHTQAQFNVDLLKRESRRKIEFDRSRAEWNALYYEVLHNLVLETTRMGIEAQNLRMRVESLSSRLDFSERRVRALEGVVQYRPEVIHAPARREREDDDEPAAAPAPWAARSKASCPAGQPGPARRARAQGDGSRKRRRRRRGRRGGAEGIGAGAGLQLVHRARRGASGCDRGHRVETEADGDYDGGPDETGGETAPADERDSK